MRLFLLALALILASCGTTTGPKVSASLLTAYDSAVAAETTFLASGKATPAMATKLRACRVLANKAVQAVVTAEQSGVAPPDTTSAAQKAVNAYLAAAGAGIGVLAADVSC